MKKTIFILICASLAAVSCTQKSTSTREPVSLVSDILANKSHPARSIVANLGNSSPSGDIYVIGSKDCCLAIQQELVNCDRHDNVDGTPRPDALPDFSGETICSIVDSIAGTAISGLAASDTLRLRELCVRHLISAMDTVCHISRYDSRGLGVKSSAKVVILADPAFERYGKFDCDTLLKTLDCNLPVLTPLSLMRDQISNRKNIAVIPAPGYENNEVYRQVFGCSCFVAAAPADSSDVLLSVLDAYAASGATAPLDALILDDGTPRRETLDAIRRIHDINCPESLKYGRLVARGFTVLDPLSAISEATYKLMRKQNLFTHGIYYPKTANYVVLPLSGDHDSDILMTLADVQD